MFRVRSACNPPTPPGARVPAPRPERPEDRPAPSPLSSSPPPPASAPPPPSDVSPAPPGASSPPAPASAAHAPAAVWLPALSFVAAKVRWCAVSRLPGHSARDGALPAHRETRAGLGAPLRQPTTSMLSSAHTHQHPQKYRSELGFILTSVIPCSPLNHSNEGMTNSVPLSITDKVTKGS